MTADQFDPGTEFDRQVQTLLAKRYPSMAGMTDDAFAELLAPLRDTAVARAAAMTPPTAGRVPFVVVIGTELAPAEQAMPRTEHRGRPGFADFDSAPFAPIPEVELPGGAAYLILDVDRGTETLNVTPDKALVELTQQRRTPLTVDEGIAFVTQHPAALAKNNCFSLVGSRCGDRRVPALWLSKGAPKLGWCWAGNPHTWLGSASCAARATQVESNTS